MGSVGSVQFQIVPCSSLYFSRSIGPFQCSQCQPQGFNLLHLSLPKWFPLFILASVCKSVQCLFSALPQGGEGGHLFRLTCSVVLWGGGTLQTNITDVCGECSHCLGYTGFAPVHDVCAFPVYNTQALGCSAWELSKAGPALCALPRSVTQVQVLGYSTKVQTWLGLSFVPFPGLSISGSQVFGERTLPR